MINYIMEKARTDADISSETIVEEEEIDCMPDIETRINYNLTINELGKKLLEASQVGDVSKIKYLLSKGAPFTADWLGTSPLHLAAFNNHQEVCEIFLRAGMCKNTRTKVERTPLHIAVYQGNVGIVECLLQHGADVDARDMLQMTPLHWAVQNGHADIAKMLICNGASTQVKNKFELTPLDIAIQIDRSDLIQIINYTVCDPIQSAKNLDEANVAVTPILELTILNDDNSNSSPQEMPLETFSIENEESQDIGEPTQELTEPEHEEQEQEKIISEEYITEESNQTSFNESMKILQQHGITMLPDDESNLISSVMESGHSVVLTEAGKQALNSIKVEKVIPVISAPVKSKPAIISQPIKKKKIITVTADQFLAMTTNSNNSLRIINGKLVQCPGNNLTTKRRVFVKKNKIVTSAETRNINVISTNNLPSVRCEPVNDVELLIEQLTKAHALVESYKKRLVKTELELQKYKQKCKLLMDQNNLNNLNV